MFPKTFKTLWPITKGPNIYDIYHICYLISVSFKSSDQLVGVYVEYANAV